MAEQTCVEIRCARDEELTSVHVFLISVLGVIALIRCRITRAIMHIFHIGVTRNMKVIYETHNLFSHVNRVSSWNRAPSLWNLDRSNL